jgi:hypothetical protein
MEEGTRRIRFLLSARNPIDAEILSWMDSLPRTARGTEMKAHLTAALIEYIRKTCAITDQVARPNSTRGVSTDTRNGDTRRELPTASEGARVPRDQPGALSSGALARHLLKDFG